jgi:hypothetical protein
MPILNYEHVDVFKRIWANASKQILKEKAGFGMVVRCKVIGDVELNDICRRVNRGEIQTFNDFEIKKSDDLRNAIQNGWLEVIKGTFPIKSIATFKEKVTAQINKNSEIMSKEEILAMAQEMARTMAIEMSKNMIKNDDVIRQIASQLASEMVAQILEKGQFIKQKEQQQVDSHDDAQDIFIDVSPEESKISTNIKDVGKIQSAKDDISGSLEKMKMFRRKQGGQA